MRDVSTSNDRDVISTQRTTAIGRLPEPHLFLRQYFCVFVSNSEFCPCMVERVSDRQSSSEANGNLALRVGPLGRSSANALTSRQKNTHTKKD